MSDHDEDVKKPCGCNSDCDCDGNCGGNCDCNGNCGTEEPVAPADAGSCGDCGCGGGCGGGDDPEPVEETTGCSGDCTGCGDEGEEDLLASKSWFGLPTWVYWLLALILGLFFGFAFFG